MIRVGWAGVAGCGKKSVSLTLFLWTTPSDTILHRLRPNLGTVGLRSQDRRLVVWSVGGNYSLIGHK